jgi:hypothetical protein
MSPLIMPAAYRLAIGDLENGVVNCATLGRTPRVERSGAPATAPRRRARG